MTHRLTSKGQVTIPKPVREHLRVGPGSGVEFDLTPEGEVVLRRAGRKARRVRSRFAAVRGSATAKLRTDEILALTRGEE